MTQDNKRKTIKLLTFNTWGLKYVSKHRKLRLKEIADKLSQTKDYDIIALQEIWVKEDWDYIDSKCSSTFKYRRWFYSGIITGPGLAILSKIPIDSTFLYRFPINGRPSAFWRGDWYVGKSVAVTLLKPAYAGATPLAILNSHMHAPYSSSGDASYSCHRACQAWDFSRIAIMLKKAGYGVILVGDLNSKPESLPHKLFTVEAGLIDSWEEINGKTNLEDLKRLDPSSQIEIGAVTCDSQLNTWRAHRRLDEACRLDYALIDNRKIKPVFAKVEFVERISGLDISYSDHFAYMVELSVCQNDQFFESNIPSLSSSSATTATTLTSKAINKESRLRVYEEFLLELHKYGKTVQWQKCWRKNHFLISIIILICLHIGIIFASYPGPWSSFLFLFFGSVIGITGTVNGLIWLLFGKYEERALEEVRLEILDSQNSVLESLS